ncbi:hypothetical protein [Brevibacterium sp. 2SA]|uniref:hypothetical protein n=1 Tax=Brevibacterium sp. 2SA TaxID=2502198 RepID=UPI0014852389|nr:hypothetical protein [Brevibacterium sp. 2SA]
MTPIRIGAAAVAVAALTLTGCGSNEPSNTPATTRAAVPSATETPVTDEEAAAATTTGV